MNRNYTDGASPSTIRKTTLDFPSSLLLCEMNFFLSLLFGIQKCLPGAEVGMEQVGRCLRKCRNHNEGKFYMKTGAFYLCALFMLGKTWVPYLGFVAEPLGLSLLIYRGRGLGFIISKDSSISKNVCIVGIFAKGNFLISIPRGSSLAIIIFT